MRNFVRSIGLFRPLADQGDADAQTTLGIMYQAGHGVPQDYAQAVEWFRLAADQGNAWAQIMLGIMYQAGDGVPQDYVEAHKWFNLSAAWASDDDKDVRDGAVNKRDILATMMTPAQVAKAQRMSREWRHK